jgi:hypothetical protein
VTRVHPGATPTAYQKPVPLELDVVLRCASTLFALASKPASRNTVRLIMTHYNSLPVADLGVTGVTIYQLSMITDQ